MTRPSLTTILSCLFIIYILNGLWSIAQLFVPPKCPDEKSPACLKSYLTLKPDLQLLLYTSPTIKTENLNLIYHDPKFNYEISFQKEFTIKLPKVTIKNGTLILTIVLAELPRKKQNYSFSELRYAENSILERIMLTQFVIPQAKSFNLLNNEHNNQTKPSFTKPVSHLKSRITFHIFTEDVQFYLKTLPPELERVIRVNKKKYLPIIQHNIFETRYKDLIEITPETTSLNITISYSAIGIGKLRLLLQMEQAIHQIYQLGFTDKDVDSVKELFADSNLYILCITIVIGGIHLLFDILAFKNDVSFWRNKKSLAGLSPRTVLWRSFSHAVIFLYLLDEKTSLLVLIPSGIGTLIEFWKITKIFKISFKFGFPCVKFYLKATTDEERLTYKHDAECMKYLSYILYPLCIVGAIYSLMYEPHRSWYSWTINSLVNGVYAFGFLFMLPQLFVNYRLKSVSALPWRAFMYKAFNTFIDDVFAFIITMPTAHRVACFRDDVVFLIYLYQRWLYPIDYTRKDDPDVQRMIDSKEETESKKTK